MLEFRLIVRLRKWVVEEEEDEVEEVEEDEDDEEEDDEDDDDLPCPEYNFLFLTGIFLTSRLPECRSLLSTLISKRAIFCTSKSLKTPLPKSSRVPAE